MKELERRSFATKIEVRSENGAPVLVGRAAAYGTLSANLGGFRETIRKGAFTRAVREKDDCVFTLNHDEKALPFGRVSSGTLQLSEDDQGLNVRCYLPNTSSARDLAESISRGDIREMSFAFAVPDGGDDWSEDYDEDGLRYPLRTLKEIKPLFDVAAVLRPAYPTGTGISVDMLPGAPMAESLVAPRALREARARGGYSPRARVVVAEPSKFELFQRIEAIGKQIAEDDYNANLAEYIANRPRHTREEKSDGK